MAIVWVQVVERARQVAAAYETPVTLRQLFYRLAAREEVIPNQPWAYRRLSSKLAESRRGGFGPELVDTTRQVHEPPAWSGAGALVAELPRLFRLDRTRGQAVALYVCAEKDTLRAQFADWLDELGVPVLVVRGFASEPYAQLVRRRTAADRRPAVLLYVGDWDASGEDVERDWVARTGCWAQVQRVVLTRDQVEEYALPPTAGKASDPRWPAWARRHGYDRQHPVQWEVEALDAAELRRLVLAAVDRYIDRQALADVVAEETRQRAALTEFGATWPGAAPGDVTP
ncbi:hypothetical protein ACFWPU_46290 [Streptomyces sp. NPDC058471]|uniref:hypothetical protein n=1 Tax=Streptomyces sp. NPDC058471 TaxID=3346516 RepID=UPI003650752B